MKTDYQGYEIHTVFNYTNGLSDFYAFEKANPEKCSTFPSETIDGVKAWIDDQVEDNGYAIRQELIQEAFNHSIKPYTKVVQEEKAREIHAMTNDELKRYVAAEKKAFKPRTYLYKDSRGHEKKIVALSFFGVPAEIDENTNYKLVSITK
jgi:hypothetical protein